MTCNALLCGCLAWSSRLRRLAHPFGRPQPHGLRGPATQNLGELRDRQAAASAPRTAPRATPLPSRHGAPPAPLAVCSRGASRPLETPPSQAPCPEPVSISSQCWTDRNRNPLWTWGFVACITFPEGRSGWVNKKVNVFPVAVDWLSFNGKTASLFS